MPVEFDWSVLKDVGIGGLAMFALWLFHKSFIFFIGQWKESTDAINRNTETHQTLHDFFKVFYEENKEYQKETTKLLRDTHKKVNDIHKEIKEGERNGTN
jgi:hypothetical protein